MRNIRWPIAEQIMYTINRIADQIEQPQQERKEEEEDG